MCDTVSIDLFTKYIVHLYVFYILTYLPTCLHHCYTLKFENKNQKSVWWNSRLNMLWKTCNFVGYSLFTGGILLVSLSSHRFLNLDIFVYFLWSLWEIKSGRYVYHRTVNWNSFLIERWKQQVEPYKLHICSANSIFKTNYYVYHFIYDHMAFRKCKLIFHRDYLYKSL